MINLCADDTTLLNLFIHELSNCDDLQADLVKLQDRTKLWLLTFNSSKCKVFRLEFNAPAMNYTLKTEGSSVTMLGESQVSEERWTSQVHDKSR